LQRRQHFCFDYAENPQAWQRSMELLAKEVMPKLAHLKPKDTPRPRSREVGDEEAMMPPFLCRP
jgi:hypothetical protein